MQRTVNGVNTYLIYDGWDLIEERDASGNLAATYVHGVRQDELLSKTDALNGTVYYHHNALGSVVNLTSTSGVVVEKYKYDVFGRPSITDGAGNPLTTSAYGNRFLFTGREWLAEVSLYDYRNRVYSADIGRFLQTDPMSFSAGDVNIYRYCGNNVLNGSDPMGLCFNDNTLDGSYSANINPGFDPSAQDPNSTNIDPEDKSGVYTGTINYAYGALILSYGSFTGQISNAAGDQYNISGSINGVGFQAGYFSGQSEVSYNVPPGSTPSNIGSNGLIITGSAGVGAGPLNILSVDSSLSLNGSGVMGSESPTPSGLLNGDSPFSTETNPAAPTEPMEMKFGAGFSFGVQGITVKQATPVLR